MIHAIYRPNLANKTIDIIDRDTGAIVVHPVTGREMRDLPYSEAARLKSDLVYALAQQRAAARKGEVAK